MFPFPTNKAQQFLSKLTFQLFEKDTGKFEMTSFQHLVTRTRSSLTLLDIYKYIDHQGDQDHINYHNVPTYFETQD